MHNAAHPDVDARRMAIEEELEFLKQVHQQEMLELQQLALQDIKGGSKEFWTNEMGNALREKVPNFLSRCHTKRMTGAALIFRAGFLKPAHTKRRVGAAPCARPSFGMTPTQEIRDLFA